MPFLGGIGVGIALLALVWVVVAAVTGGSDQSQSSLGGAGGADASTGSRPSVVAAPPRAERSERCAGAAQSLEEPLTEAAPAMDQWEVHIGAMNKLVTGAITLPQANAFWNQTRVGAHHRIAAFDQAMAAQRRHGVDCPAPRMLPSRASAAVASCARRVAADARALRIARTAVATWGRHVHHMEMLRDGTMSPATATQLWLASWQRGADQLHDYRIATRAARRAGSCP